MTPTSDQLDRMRIRCAELCGEEPFSWYFVYHHEEGSDESMLYKSLALAQKDWSGLYNGPEYAEPIFTKITCRDYPRDLNAMHSIEKTHLVEDEHIEQYMEILTDVCGGDVPANSASFTAYFAEAWQRCLAFIRVHDPEFKL